MPSTSTISGQLKHLTDNCQEYAKRLLPTIRRFLLDDHSILEQSGQQQSSSNSNVPSSSSFSLISNFESQIIELQSLLIWENPKNSILALIIFTCFYWVIVLWEPRLLSVIAILLFCYHFYEMWTRYVWPEIRVPTHEIKENWTAVNPKVLSAPEIKLYFNRVKLLLMDWLYRISEFRRRSHGAFCCYSIVFFLYFYYVGYFIPGVLITYFTAIILFLTPGFLVHVMPKNTFDDVLFSQEHLSQQSQPTIRQVNHSTLESTTDDETTELEESSSAQPPQPTTSRINSRISELFENHFEQQPESPKSSSSESDDSEFVMISDSDLMDM